MNTSQCVEVLAQTGAEQGWAVVVAIAAVGVGTGLLVARRRPGRRGHLDVMAFIVVALGAGLTVGPFGYVAPAAACPAQADPASAVSAAVAADVPAPSDVVPGPESPAPDPVPAPDPAPVPDLVPAPDPALVPDLVPAPDPAPTPDPVPEFVMASCPADNDITILPAGHRIGWDPIAGPDALPSAPVDGEFAMVWEKATSGYAWQVLGTEGSASGPCTGMPVENGVCVPFPTVFGEWWYWSDDPGEWMSAGSVIWGGCGGGGGGDN